MNTAEGFNRVAKVIVILGWVIGTVCIVYMLISVMKGDVGDSLIGAVVMGGGSVAVAKGIAWIITGFTVPKKEG